MTGKRALLTTACALALLPALAAGADRPGRTTSAVWSGSGHAAGQPDPNRGRFVAIGGEFGELRFACSSCHGFEGQGDASGAFPRLADQSAWYLYGTLRDFASGARPSKVMGPIAAELSEAQMQDVAAYYASVADVPFPPELRHDDRLVEQGRRIANTAMADDGPPACARCHGESGIGNAPLYPYLAGQYQPYLEQQLELFRAGRRGGDPMGVMHAVAQQLSNDQIHALAVYFASLRPENLTPGGGPSPVVARPPQPLPMRTGAVMSPKPGEGDIVVPGASSSGPPQ